MSILPDLRTHQRFLQILMPILVFCLDSHAESKTSNAIITKGFPEQKRRGIPFSSVIFEPELSNVFCRSSLIAARSEDSHSSNSVWLAAAKQWDSPCSSNMNIYCCSSKVVSPTNIIIIGHPTNNKIVCIPSSLTEVNNRSMGTPAIVRACELWRGIKPYSIYSHGNWWEARGDWGTSGRL